jgi:isoleucyl-tRNA synthetase
VSRYKAVPKKVNFPELDHTILKLWEDEKIFKQVQNLRAGERNWVFYDGPPGTNGLPHIGHMLHSALKDLWPRYKTMRGYNVVRRAGWDTHGLPVELKAEKELGLADKSEIPAFGVEKFQEHCRSTVFRFKDEWEKAITRIGRFLDLEDHYATLTNDYIQTDWWVIKQIWDKDLLYRDFKIMPYCARCGTTLSSHEVAQGYKDVKDMTLTARFQLKDEEKVFFLAWTTTPWTLIGNTALALGPDVVYVRVKLSDETLILAESLLEKVIADQEYEIISRHQGSELAGIEYLPLWDFFAGVDSEGRQGHFTLADDYVTDDDGTGIVHLALYGEDDYRLIAKNDLPRIQHVNDSGNFVGKCGQYAGRYFKEDGLDIDILKDLSARGLLYHKQKYEHSYPHCYKCETPLMYHAKASWFIKTTAVKDQMLQANREINWMPASIREGRFGSWLENNIDWAVSRERYWGSPLPVWVCQDEDCAKQICIESITDLQKYTDQKLDPEMDLHTPWIDEISVNCPSCGKKTVREPYVLDCWFNAGVMPWGQHGYPHKKGSQEKFEQQFPADFISEGLDQTRGWFYNLLAVSTILTGKSSYKNVICTGLIADKDGRKMSKTFGNVISPMDVFEKFGADAVRWTFYNSHPWNAKRFSEDLIREAVKQILIPYWNIYSFFVTYAEIDDWSPEKGLLKPDNELDRWILSATERLSSKVIKSLEKFDVFTASENIVDHLDELSNWYIRRSRGRFWKSDDDQDKQSAYSTLYRAIKELTYILAPFLPFVTEYVYQNMLKRAEPDLPASVHLCDWPEPQEQYRDRFLEREMDLVYHAVKLGRSLRSQHQLKVRQPLAKMLIVVGREEDDTCIHRMAGLIKDELNVKAVEISRNETELVEISVKANFRSLGKKYGPAMKEAAAIISTWGIEQIEMLERGEMLEVLEKMVKREDVTIHRKERAGLKVITEHGFTIALDTELNPDLIREGLSRELISRIQNLRKDSGFEVSDKIEVKISGDAKISEVVDCFAERICHETLAQKLEYSADLATESITEIDGMNIGLELKVIR